MRDALGSGHLCGDLIPTIHREPITRILSLRVGVTIHQHPDRRESTRSRLSLGTLGRADHIDQLTITQ